MEISMNTSKKINETKLNMHTIPQNKIRNKLLFSMNTNEKKGVTFEYICIVENVKTMKYDSGKKFMICTQF